MNFDQLIYKAESENNLFGDINCTRIYISAFDDIPTLQDISNTFFIQTEKNDINTEIIVTGSLGYYDLEPIVTVDKPDRPSVMFRNVTPEIAEIIVDSYVINDKPVGEVTLGTIGDEKIEGIQNVDELPLFSLQNRTKKVLLT